MKFCRHCGKEINEKAVVCIHCGCSVKEEKQEAKQKEVNVKVENNNVNAAYNFPYYCNEPRDKYVALLLCALFGYFGVHKFYERKIVLGIVYLLTGGVFGLGVLIDFINLCFKPRFYYV